MFRGGVDPWQTAMDRWWNRTEQTYPQLSIEYGHPLPGRPDQQAGLPLHQVTRPARKSRVVERGAPNPPRGSPFLSRYASNCSQRSLSLAGRCTTVGCSVLRQARSSYLTTNKTTRQRCPTTRRWRVSYNRPNLVHGYAYRIINGWRLTDWEHRPVDDPYTTSQVLRKLNQKPQEYEQPEEPKDYDRLHYGLPMPAEG